MPYLVRDRLFIGAIKDAADILQQNSPGEITHILSLLSSASISFFSDWRSSFSVPTQEIRKVFAGGSGSPSCSDDEIDESKKAVGPLDKLLYNLELAGPDLKLIRMGVPLRDMESENLLDYLDVCLDFIERSRREGSVLVHCFAGVSRSAAVITAYLMKTEQLSQEDALESLRQSCEFVCPNDGFLDQIRSHAQKYFLKVQKNGTSEHAPPPQPKRKAAHPYPQKASKNAPLLPQANMAFQSSSCLLEPGYALRTDSSSMLRNSTTSAAVSSWANSSVPPVSVSHVTKDDIGAAGPTVVNNCCCSSTESPSTTWTTCEKTDQGNHGPALRGGDAEKFSLIQVASLIEVLAKNVQHPHQAVVQYMADLVKAQETPQLVMKK